LDSNSSLLLEYDRILFYRYYMLVLAQFFISEIFVFRKCFVKIIQYVLTAKVRFVEQF